MMSVALCALLLGMGNPPPPPALAAATFVYGKGDSARCFSMQFLALVAAHSTVRAPERLDTIPLRSPDAAAYPFCLLSGEGTFALARDEKENLRAYLLGGGFVLASAGCSSAAWDASFRDTLRELFPDAALEPLPADHPVFTFLFPCERPRLKDSAEATLFGLVLGGRTACIYSPAGLNDTASLPDCCCCTGNEIEGAGRLAANAFLYALLGADA
jgi:hypothetical protein